MEKGLMMKMENLTPKQIGTIIQQSNDIYDSCHEATGHYHKYEDILKSIAWLLFMVDSKSYSQKTIDDHIEILNQESIDEMELFDAEQLQRRDGDWAGSR